MAEMTFRIAGGPGIEVHVEEIDGDLRFTVSVLGDGGLTADLRGFFFQLADESLLAGLTMSAGDAAATEFRAGEDSVINLGQGANMQGAASAFDVGVEIGTAGAGRDDIQSFTFMLSHDSEALTLDLIASQEFGVRLTSVGTEEGERTDGLKLVGTASAVVDENTPPVAVEDAVGTTEDAPIVINVLANDSDADGDALTVSLGSATSAFGATISVNGDGTIAYDPTTSAALGTLNSGDSETDSFTYTITDAAGATSSTTVEVLVSGVTDVVDGFLGKTLDYTYDFLGSPFYNTDVTVTDAVEVPSIQGPSVPPAAVSSLNITDTQLIITFAPGETFFAGGGFNGIRIQDQFGELNAITGVQINSSSGLFGFDASDISVTQDSIALDFADVAYNMEPGPQLILDVFFA